MDNNLFKNLINSNANTKLSFIKIYKAFSLLVPSISGLSLYWPTEFLAGKEVAIYVAAIGILVAAVINGIVRLKLGTRQIDFQENTDTGNNNLELLKLGYAEVKETRQDLKDAIEKLGEHTENLLQKQRDDFIKTQREDRVHYEERFDMLRSEGHDRLAKASEQGNKANTRLIILEQAIKMEGYILDSNNQLVKIK